MRLVKIPRFIFDAEDPSLWSPGCDGHPSVAAAVKAHVLHETGFERKGSRTNMNRFMSCLIKGREVNRVWTKKYFGYSLGCMEEDLLASANAKRYLLKLGLDSAERGTTANAKNTSAESSLERAQVCLLVVAMLSFGDERAQIRQRAINEVLEPLLTWYKGMSVNVRSVGDATAWLKGQLKHDFFAHLNTVIRTLGSEDSLMKIGMHLPNTNPQVRFRDPNTAGSAVEVDLEDELAGDIGRLTCACLGARICRSLCFLLGWSARSILWEDDAHELQCFKRCGDHFDQAVRESDEGNLPGMQPILHRSQHKTAPVRQLRRIMEESLWVLTPAVRLFLHKKHSRLIQSIVCEDAFNVQKASKRFAKNRKLNCARAMADILETKVTTAKHHFLQPHLDVRSQPRGGRLPDAAFEVPAYFEGQAEPVKKVSSFSAHTTWYSCGPPRHGVKFADEALLTDVMSCPAGKDLRKAWMGCVALPKHQVILRRAHAGIGPASRPFIGVGHLPGSAAVGWPVVENAVPGHDGHFGWSLESVDPGIRVERLLLPVLDMHEWEAFTVTWRSPAWQELTFPGCSMQWPRVVRAFSGGREGDGRMRWVPLIQCIAEEGCFDFDVSELRNFASAVGCNLPAGTSAFDGAYRIVQHVLQCSAEEAMEILKHRSRCILNSVKNS